MSEYFTNEAYYDISTIMSQISWHLYMVKSVCSARDFCWGSLWDLGEGLGETLGIQTQYVVAIKESK